MTDYSKMTDADFDRILRDILKGMTGEQLLSIEGVYELVSEEFNNEILDRWAAENHECCDICGEEFPKGTLTPDPGALLICKNCRDENEQDERDLKRCSD